MKFLLLFLATQRVPGSVLQIPPSLATYNKTKGMPLVLIVAEREGFEPSSAFTRWHVSSVLVSTTHPPLQCRPYYARCSFFSNVLDCVSQTISSIFQPSCCSLFVHWSPIPMHEHHDSQVCSPHHCAICLMLM